MENIDQQNGNALVHHKIVEKEINVPNTYIINGNNGGDGSNNNLVAIAGIFIVLSLLCGIVCFILGGSVGRGVGYQQGKKAVKEEKRKELLDERDIESV